MPDFNAILEQIQAVHFWGNSLERWLIALAAAIGLAVVLWATKRVLARRATRLAERRPGEWFDAARNLVQATGVSFLLIVSLYAASLVLLLPERAARIATLVTVTALLIQGAIWGDALVRFFLLQRAKQRVEGDGAAATTLAALGFLGRVSIWTVVLLLILANLGVDVTAMIAGLGIGGVAVALAAQNVLGDLFASASIVLDKPFVLGDFIIVGQDMGTVEHIGLKTTRLRSLAGEQLVFSNGELLKSRIRNMKRMQQRRALFTVGVTYQTPADKLAAIPAMLRQAVEAQSPTRFDRAHFKQYGDFALIFEVVYFVLTADYNVFMDIQQAINLDIFSRFGEAGIEFAYPTQTLHLVRKDAE